MNSENGWLNNVEITPSPNCNDRPTEEVSLLVIHNISLPPGQFGSRDIEDFFLNQLDCSAHPFFAEIKDLAVSAHFLIKRTGVITQFVPVDKRAWHAGVSCFQEREGCNDFSIGIELEGTDIDPYTDEQYAALTDLTQALRKRYPAITLDRIVGHNDIAPDRKTDPGPAFDWNRFKRGLLF